MSIVICDRCGKIHRGNFETCTECINSDIKGWKYSIKKGKKYINKDGKVVEVIDVVDTKVYFKYLDFPRNVIMVLYRRLDSFYVDEVNTFSKEYKLVEPVYEYKFAVKTICSTEEEFVWEMTRHYYTIEEAPENINAEYKVLEFTKRERKCQ